MWFLEFFALCLLHFPLAMGLGIDSMCAAANVAQ